MKDNIFSSKELSLRTPSLNLKVNRKLDNICFAIFAKLRKRINSGKKFNLYFFLFYTKVLLISAYKI